MTFISTQMVPHRYRASRDDVAFLAIKSLGWDSAIRLMSALLKRRRVEVNSDSLEELTKLSEGHPFNIYRVVDEVFERGVKTFLANPYDFIEWKHRQTSEYVSRICFSANTSAVLALLKSIPELDFDTIANALNFDGAALADDLQRLVLLHVFDSGGDRFRISPALRVAIERDARVKMPAKQHADATSSVARSLSLRIEEGTAPVSLRNSAVLASIESGNILTELAGAFLLPSHYVWLAKLPIRPTPMVGEYSVRIQSFEGSAIEQRTGCYLSISLPRRRASLGKMKSLIEQSRSCKTERVTIGLVVT